MSPILVKISVTIILAIKLNVVKIPINCWLISKCENVTVNKVDPQICGMLPIASTIIIMILFLDLNREKNIQSQ